MSVCVVFETTLLINVLVTARACLQGIVGCFSLNRCSGTNPGIKRYASYKVVSDLSAVLKKILCKLLCMFVKDLGLIKVF